MLNIQISKQAGAFLGQIPAKHARQIAERITSVRNDPASVHSEDLKGYSPFRRFKSGEYRVVFFIDATTRTLHIPIIGKRNDDEIYKLIARFQR